MKQFRSRESFLLVLAILAGFGLSGCSDGGAGDSEPNTPGVTGSGDVPSPNVGEPSANGTMPAVATEPTVNGMPGTPATSGVPSTSGAGGDSTGGEANAAGSPASTSNPPTGTGGDGNSVAAGSGGTSSAEGGSPGASAGGEAGAGGDPGPNTGGAGGMSSDQQPVDADCNALATDPNVNWRQSSQLQTDQDIVECLSRTLGRAVGYGENALGGYDPNGNSKLTVITSDGSRSVEEQLLEAISGDEHNWIVFDKADFAEPYEIGMYRLHCSDAAVLGALAGSEAECRDYSSWCSSRGFGGEEQCLEEFFNVALNNGDLPIRNPIIGSNKTIDGRMSEAYFRFSGFAIGQDSDGQPSQTSTGVILTHLNFEGAGHTEDHELDPDMIRATGASQDIWIHKNDFDLTGDSAFDVKVGAYDITMSFNRVVDVLRASLHGSSDSREINQQITTTMHHNAFVTRDARYTTLGNTGRRVPLIRRGTSHMFNNVFVNYRKDILSIRVGASVLWEDNVLLINKSLQEKSTVEESLDELSANLLRDIDDGNLRVAGTSLWFADGACILDAATQRPLVPSSGTVSNLAEQYSSASQAVISSERLTAGQQLVDYVTATAGKYGAVPFNSPLADEVAAVLSESGRSCQ